MKRKRITIKEVAENVGVHTSTVSRVLNPKTRFLVSEQVADRVLKVADKLGYRHNPLASSLRTMRSYTIGVMIPDLTNPIFPPIVRAIERTLGPKGYVVMLGDTDNDLRNERAILDTMLGRQADGLILATAHRRDQMITECIEHEIPFVLVNRTISQNQISAVINDDTVGIELAMSHLYELGHRKIAYLGGPQDTSTGYERYRAFLSAAKLFGIKIDRKIVVNCKAYTEKEGYKHFSSLLNNFDRFTAIVCANDLLALGCYDVLAEKEMRCPADISITGFNDMPFVDRLTPPLTTLCIPLDELGTQAAKLLIEQLNDDDFSHKLVKLHPQLILRGSTGTPRQ